MYTAAFTAVVGAQLVNEETLASVNQHQPLIHAISRELQRHSIRDVVEDGSPFPQDHHLRIYISVPRRTFRKLRTVSTAN